MLAIGSLIQALFSGLGQKAPEPVAVVSVVSDWVLLHGDVATADNAGSAITVPSTQIIDADARIVDCLGKGTIAELCVQYTATRTLSTDPVFNLFGLSSALGTSTPSTTTGQFTPTANTPTSNVISGIPKALRTAALGYDFSVPDDATNDPSDGTYKYTASVTVDLTGLRYLVAGVKTAAVLSGAGTAKLLVRFY
jgi:hypothetical protein